MTVRPPVGPVQLQPAGLLGLLQLKTGGFSPDAMKQDVQPTVPIDGYWVRSAAQQKIDVYRQLVAAPGAYNSVIALLTTGLLQLAPGNKDWWYVENVTVACTADTGVTCNIAQLAMAIAGGPATLGETVLALGEPTYAIASTEVRILSAGGFWAPPGSRIGVYVGDTGGLGNLDCYMLGIRYTPCPT